MRNLSVLVVVLAVAVAFVLVGCSEPTPPVKDLSKMTADELKAEIVKLDAAVVTAQKAADKAAADLKDAGTDAAKVTAALPVADKTAAALKAATEAKDAAVAALAKATAAPVKP